MILRAVYLIMALAFSFVAGCGTAFDPGVAREPRVTQPSFDAEKTVTVLKEMAWYSPSAPKKGIWFTPGTYVLEAEDAEFWFFRSPKPIKTGVVGDRGELSARRVPGGIMISKRFPSAYIAGGGYIEDRAGTKVMVWELTNDFRSMEGMFWTKSF
jgi:hypothetical protein